MEKAESPMPDFGNPPVIEVVFGIQFDELRDMKAPHLGFFWEKLGRTEYPECQEMPPLASVKETYGETFEPSESIAMFRSRPPLPRLFYLNSKKDRLIQLQEDRLLQNWKKAEGPIEYPRFKALFPEFQKSWHLFLEFAQEQGLGNPKPNQYELTYLNHIPQGEGWLSPKDTVKVFPDFRCDAKTCFLPEPEGVSWKKIFKFPDNKGRLHASMKQAVHRETKKTVFVLDLTARGFSDKGLEDWFGIAHDWIVRGFADLTSIDVQKAIWKRIK
jgi:uncharacterized protein (TIGR04255 family)